MPRSVRARIETRSARLRLSPRKDPYWQQLEQGVSCGYYRPQGTWWRRARVNGRYTIESFAIADDHVDADGQHVLNWVQAQAVVRAWAAKQTGAGPLTVAEVVHDYLDDLCARKGERAALSARGGLRKHLSPALSARRVADLTVADLLAWRNGMVPTNGADEERMRRARDKANRIFTILKAALNHAFRNDRVADDRAWRRVGAFHNVGMARKVILDPAQIQRLVSACKPGLRELVAAGAQTGARLGELTGACVRDFDPDAGTLRLDGKTGERVIHLAPATILLLRRAASGKRPDDFLLTPVNHPRWSRSLHRWPFEAAVRIAGLDPATCFYSLRHSYISHALKHLVPIKAVADHCGTSMTMLERHYAKVLTGDKARYAAIAAVDLEIGSTDVEVVPLRRAV